MKKLFNKKTLSIANLVLMYCGFAVLFLGVIFFAYANDAMIFDAGVFCTIFAALIAGGVVASVLIQSEGEGRTLKIIAIVSVCAAAVMCVLIVVFALGVDFFQPLALSIDSIVTLSVGMFVILLSLVFALILSQNAVKIITAAVTVILIMTVGLIWSGAQGYGEFKNVEYKQFVFTDGEGGYSTFRLPSLVVMDGGTVTTLLGVESDKDILVAMAEGRKNSSRDRGEIDIVYKVSADGGENWTDIKVLVSGHGEKAGNQTVLFDIEDAELHIMYMLGSRDGKYSYKTYAAKGILQSDLSIKLADTQELPLEYDESGANNNYIMTGPGKGCQTGTGRLVMPCSSRGYSYAMYSDDNGSTWTRGYNACEGNECEIAALQDGRLIMVSRAESRSLFTLSDKNHLRFCYSYDGGESWTEVSERDNLRTPTCMTSVASFGNVAYATFPDDYTTRANLTVAYSGNGGEDFTKRTVYSGASGYSCAVTDSQGNLMILAELGKLNYNEALVFIKVSKLA